MNTGDQVTTPTGPAVVIRFQRLEYGWRRGRPHREWWTWVRYPDGDEQPWPAGNVRRVLSNRQTNDQGGTMSDTDTTTERTTTVERTTIEHDTTTEPAAPEPATPQQMPLPDPEPEPDEPDTGEDEPDTPDGGEDDDPATAE